MTEHDEQVIAPAGADVERRRERREFFRTVLGAAAVTAVGAAAVTIASTATAQSTSDMDILNFALNLEYLEANFYAFATTGAAIASPLATGTGTQGAATGGRAVTFTDPLLAQAAREIAADKLAHVTYLRSVLGAAAVAQPAIDLGSTATSAFSTAMRAAGVVTAGTAFDPYASDANFLLAAFLFEDVAVSAYRGAATVIVDKGYLETGAGLLGTAAYHSAIIRTTLYVKGATTASLRTSADAISNARDQLDGVSDDDQGISPVTLSDANAPLAPAALKGQIASNIVPTGPDGLTFGRAAASVLNIAFLNSATVTKGGFFSNGINGVYGTSTAN